MLMKIGANIKAHRVRAGLSKIELARMAGVSVCSIRRIEGGQGSNLYTLLVVMRLLGLSEKEVFEGVFG